MNEYPSSEHVVMRERQELVRDMRRFLAEHEQGLRPHATREQLDLAQTVSDYGDACTGGPWLPVASLIRDRKVSPEAVDLITRRIAALDEAVELEEEADLGDQVSQERLSQLWHELREVEAVADEIVDEAAEQLADR